MVLRTEACARAGGGGGAQWAAVVVVVAHSVRQWLKVGATPRLPTQALAPPRTSAAFLMSWPSMTTAPVQGS